MYVCIKYVCMYVCVVTGFDVHRSSGFVHDDDLGFGEQRSGDAQQLPLPHGIVAATLCHHYGVCMYVCM